MCVAACELARVDAGKAEGAVVLPWSAGWPSDFHGADLGASIFNSATAGAEDLILPKAYLTNSASRTASRR
jgi:hypothetical protein